jgi:hypothetical protein
MPSPRSARTVVIATTLAALLAACQSAPVTLLADPNAILAAAATTTASATAVHVDVSGDGRLGLDALGTGVVTPIDLRGSTAAADLDLAGRATRATFALPGLLDLGGEIVAVPDVVYLKTTLTGPKYRATPAGPAGASPAPSAGSPLKGLADLLARTDLQPTKGADASCAGGTCYTITIALTAAELGSLGTGVRLPANLPIQVPDLANAGIDLTLHVDQATTRLSDVHAVVHLGAVGEPSVDLTFTKWNEPPSIAAPPADQVEPAG